MICFDVIIDLITDILADCACVLLLFVLARTQLPLNNIDAEQNDRRLAEDIFKCIFLNQDVCISIKGLFLRVQLTLLQHWFR